MSSKSPVPFPYKDYECHDMTKRGSQHRVNRFVRCGADGVVYFDIPPAFEDVGMNHGVIPLPGGECVMHSDDVMTQLDIYQDDRELPQTFVFFDDQWREIQLTGRKKEILPDEPILAEVVTDTSQLATSEETDGVPSPIDYNSRYHERYVVDDLAVSNLITLTPDGDVAVKTNFGEVVVSDSVIPFDDGKVVVNQSPNGNTQLDIRFNSRTTHTFLHEYGLWYAIQYTARGDLALPIASDALDAIKYRSVDVNRDRIDYQKYKDHGAFEVDLERNHPKWDCFMELRSDGTVYFKDIDKAIRTRSGMLPWKSVEYLLTSDGNETQLDFFWEAPDVYKDTTNTFVWKGGKWYRVDLDGLEPWKKRSPALRVEFERFEPDEGFSLWSFIKPNPDIGGGVILRGDGTVYFEDDKWTARVDIQGRPDKAVYRAPHAQLILRNNMNDPDGRPMLQFDVVFTEQTEDDPRTFLFRHGEGTYQWMEVHYPWQAKKKRFRKPKPKDWPNTLYERRDLSPDGADRGELLRPSVSDGRQFLQDAIRIAVSEKSRPVNFPPLIWNGIPLRDESALTHCLVHGRVGSGKSILLKDVLRQAVERYKVDPRVRILVTDPKPDMVPLLDELGMEGKYRIVNPFDARAHAWDISQDLKNPVTIKNFASYLFPLEESSEAFWPKSARKLFLEIALAFIQNAHEWRLRDVLLAASSPTILERVLSQTPSGRKFLESTSRSQTTRANMIQQAQQSMEEFHEIATAAEAPIEEGRKFSIARWADRTDTKYPILVLGNDESGSEILDKYYKGIIELCRMALLTGQEVKSPITWLIIDEAIMLAGLKDLPSFADRGRSKGVLLCLATQNAVRFIEKADKIHPGSGKFIEDLSNKSLLGCSGEAAEWSSKMFSKVHKKSWNENVGSSSGETRGAMFSGDSTNTGQSEGHSTSDHIVDAVDKHVFEELPNASTQTGVHSYVKSDGAISGGSWKDTFPFRSKPHDWPPRSWPPRPTSTNAYHAVDKDGLWLTDWTLNDLSRLNLDEDAGDAPVKEEQPEAEAPIPVPKSQEAAPKPKHDGGGEDNKATGVYVPDW